MFNVGLFILLMMIIGIHAGEYCDPSKKSKLCNGKCFRNAGIVYVVNWEKVRDVCLKDEFLAEPRSPEEVDFIRNWSREPKDIWIGGKLDGDNWKWNKTGDLINWGDFSPYKPFGEGDCLMIKNNIYGDNDPNNIIKKEDCTRTRKGMCQKPASQTPYPGQAVSNPETEPGTCPLYDGTDKQENKPDSNHGEDVEEDQETKTCVSQLDCGIHTLSDINGSCVCACLKGYKNVDSQTCVDVDECSTSPSVCGDENCVNTEGSFTCQETGFFDKPAVKIAGVAIAVVGTVVASVGIASMLTGFFSKAGGKANPLQTDGNQKDIDGVNADGMKSGLSKADSSSSSSSKSTNSWLPNLSSFSLFSASSKTSKVSQTDETEVNIASGTEI